MLQQQQFFDADRYIDPQRWMAIERFKMEQSPAAPPSDAENRVLRQRANRGRLESMEMRLSDENAHNALRGDPSMEGETPYRRTEEYGLRSTDGLSKDPNWKEGDSFKRVPEWATYHNSSRAGWRNNTIDAEVNLYDLVSRQGEVSSSRVSELIEHPERSSSPRLPYREKLRVWRDDTSPDDMLVDGNHRATGALSRGEMFQPAQIATPASEQGMTAAADRLRANKDAAAKKKAAAGRVNPHGMFAGLWS